MYVSGNVNKTWGGRGLNLDNTCTVFKPGSTIVPFKHIFMFWRRKNKFLRRLGTENLLQYQLQTHCDQLLLLVV